MSCNVWSPPAQWIVSCPTWLPSAPLDSLIDGKLICNDLSLESNGCTYKQSINKLFLHRLIIFYIFKESNHYVCWGKSVLCCVWSLYKNWSSIWKIITLRPTPVPVSLGGLRLHGGSMTDMDIWLVQPVCLSMQQSQSTGSVDTQTSLAQITFFTFLFCITDVRDRCRHINTDFF